MLHIYYFTEPKQYQIFKNVVTSYVIGTHEVRLHSHAACRNLLRVYKPLHGNCWLGRFTLLL